MIIASKYSARNLAKQNHENNRIVYHKARCHPKCDEFIIKMDTIEMGFDFHQADLWFNP